MIGCMNHPGIPADSELIASCGPPLCTECARSALLPDVAPVETPAAQIKLVTLCGSMRFVELMWQVAAQETARGWIVLAPFVVVTHEEQDGQFKTRLDELHRRKIDLSNRVLVVTDETGYWGPSTDAEMAYARGRGVAVTIRRVRRGCLARGSSVGYGS